MNYSIESGKHSADKDHRIMTGGTLTVDKTVRCDSGVTFYTYSIPMYSGVFDEEFHKGVHCAEHLIAYKKDTGSVRNSLEEVTQGEKQGKVILDISPYRTSKNTFGFRITSMIPLEIKQVQELTKLSISRAISFLEGGEVENTEDYDGIPFARDIACGQFDFHDKQRAIKDLKAINIEALEIQDNTISSTHKTAYVCDLRFLKPKIKGSEGMVMFSPEFSYMISELIEKHLPERVDGSIALVGTFGCMTGMYLCISSEKGDESDIPTIHMHIIDILKQYVNIEGLGEDEKVQLDALFRKYEDYKQ